MTDTSLQKTQTTEPAQDAHKLALDRVDRAIEAYEEDGTDAARTELVEAISEFQLSAQVSKGFLIGDLTMAKVFRPNGLKNLSDLQAVLDATEKAFADLVGEAEVGEALQETISKNMDHPAMKGWFPTDCPSEIVCDLLNSIDEARSWQPIETAPPDTRIIIVVEGHPDHEPIVGEAQYYSEPKAWYWAGITPEDYHGDCIENTSFGAPTRWMPLPKP